MLALGLSNFGALDKISRVRLMNLPYGDTKEERHAFEAETWVSILHEEKSTRSLTSMRSQVARCGP